MILATRGNAKPRNCTAEGGVQTRRSGIRTARLYGQGCLRCLAELLLESATSAASNVNSIDQKDKTHCGTTQKKVTIEKAGQFKRCKSFVLEGGVRGGCTAGPQMK